MCIRSCITSMSISWCIFGESCIEDFRFAARDIPCSLWPWSRLAWSRTSLGWSSHLLVLSWVRWVSLLKEFIDFDMYKQSRRKTVLLKNCKFHMYTTHWFTMVIKSLDNLKLAWILTYDWKLTFNSLFSGGVGALYLLCFYCFVWQNAEHNARCASLHSVCIYLGSSRSESTELTYSQGY